MGLSRLDMLYRQVILDHSNHPRHFGLEEDGVHEVELHNPTCGDIIKLQLTIEDQCIKDARFESSGCSISTASASMMTEAIIGKTVEEALALSETFSEMVQGQSIKNEKALGDAALLKGVAKFPARIKCATLGWKALEKGITEQQDTTEVRQLHQEEE